MISNANPDPFRKETFLYHRLDDKNVKCNTCSHHCTIHDGNWGYCKTKKNENGILYSFNYGLVSSYSINPIEKKPLFHYYPGSYALTIGGVSCNFKCPWCQNWSISKTNPQEFKANFTSPKEISHKIDGGKDITGISVSFNEPTLSLEYAVDIFNLLNPKTYKMFVTNGYMSKQALNILIKSGLSGTSVTLKGNEFTVAKYCKADVNKVWENISYAISQKVHVEVVCLIIPSVNDTLDFYMEVANRLVAISDNIPLHFTRFFPDYQFTHVSPTPITTLETAHSIAKESGLHYVYLGNIPGHPLENTYCHHCQSLLVKRSGYQITSSKNLELGKCPECGVEIPFVC